MNIGLLIVLGLLAVAVIVLVVVIVKLRRKNRRDNAFCDFWQEAAQGYKQQWYLEAEKNERLTKQKRNKK
jgi:hypothetical protein